MAISDLFEKAPHLIRGKIQNFMFSIPHLNIFQIIYRFSVQTAQGKQIYIKRKM